MTERDSLSGMGDSSCFAQAGSDDFGQKQVMLANSDELPLDPWANDPVPLPGSTRKLGQVLHHNGMPLNLVPADCGG